MRSGRKNGFERLDELWMEQARLSLSHVAFTAIRRSSSSSSTSTVCSSNLALWIMLYFGGKMETYERRLRLRKTRFREERKGPQTNVIVYERLGDRIRITRFQAHIQIPKPGLSSLLQPLPQTTTTFRIAARTALVVSIKPLQLCLDHHSIPILTCVYATHRLIDFSLFSSILHTV